MTSWLAISTFLLYLAVSFGFDDFTDLFSPVGSENGFQPWECPVGWVLNDVSKSCYRRVLKKVSQPKALEFCRTASADLASFHSEDEHLFVLNQIVKERERVWIGFETTGNNQVTNRSWTDGSNVDYTSPANLGELTTQRAGVSDKHCFFFFKETSAHGIWTSDQCEEKSTINGFICKMPAMFCAFPTTTTSTVPSTVTTPTTTSDAPTTTEVPTTTSASPTTCYHPIKDPREITCPDGWTPYMEPIDVNRNSSFPVKCFYIDPKTITDKVVRTYDEAVEYCRSEHDATLATFYNKNEEMKLIETMLNALKDAGLRKILKCPMPGDFSYICGKLSVWIGYQRKDNSSNCYRDGWVWDDKTPNNYNDWQRYEPDLPSDLCARLKIHDDDNYFIWGEECDSKMWVACQKSGYDFS